MNQGHKIDLLSVMHMTHEHYFVVKSGGNWGKAAKSCKSG